MIIFNVFNGRKRIKTETKLNATVTTTNYIATEMSSHESDIIPKITSL